MSLSDNELALLRECSKDETAFQKLQAFYGALSEREQQYRSVVETEKLRLEQEKLQLLLKKEKDLSKLRTMMMTRISHEFRTPLAIVLTSCDLLERHFDRIDPEKRRDHLHKIRVQVHRIAGMLDDIGAMVQGLAQQANPQSKAFTLDELCAEIIARIQSTSGIHHHCLYTLIGTPRPVVADENLFHALIMALLSNALKYSPLQSIVHLELNYHPAGQGIVLHVRNNGQGIPTHELPRIFEPFFRGESTGGTSGLGLGLSMAQEIVTLYNGTISVESKPGETTVFTVRLPL